MELFLFIILCILGFFTIILEKRSIFKYLYIPFLLGFLVCVRLNAFAFKGFEIDILTYAIEMQATSFDFYYLREFIFWFALRFVYYITDSELLSFILLDFFWVYLLIKASANQESKGFRNGLVIILATSFPFFFGYENIYRQFYAMVVSLYAYSIIHYKPYKASLVFIITIFIHNLTLFLIPLFIIKKYYSFKIKDRVFLSSFIAISYITILPFIMSFKDADPTEIDLSFLYLFLFLSLFGIFLFKFKDNFFSFIRKVPSLFPIIILICGFVSHSQEMIAERLSMMFIAFLLYDLYGFSNTINNTLKRRVIRLILLLAFTVPIFLSSSAMLFLR
jgi:hypothetical protein